MWHNVPQGNDLLYIFCPHRTAPAPDTTVSSIITTFASCFDHKITSVLGSQRSRSNMGLLVADLGTAAELPGKQMCGVAGKTDVRGGGSVCPVDYCGCSLLGKGVAAVLSCTSCPANFGLQTVANSLHVPHVFVSQDNCRVMHSRGYTVSMRPSQEEVDRDLVDVITRLKWKSMMILFDDYYDFSHVQNLLSLTRKTFLEVVLLRVEKFTGGNDVTEWQANAKKSPLVEYGGKLRRAVLLCSAENSVRLASGVGILTPEHNWIIANKEVTLETLQSLHTSSDVFTVMRRPLSYNEYTSRFLRHWATLTNGDQDGRALQDARLSAAYMYDAVHLLASAFSSLLNTRGWIGPNRLTCVLKPISTPTQLPVFDMCQAKLQIQDKMTTSQLLQS
ncbi:Glutamate receptor ionotropic, delta-1 [Branchiostoma belcheri]|nr:Glutamate receptor ionotropic, delta-1 [Branchiostoma belcheri]